MVSCSMRKCNSRKHSRKDVEKKKLKGITFHRFPKNVERRRDWVKFVNREEWQPTKYSVICSKHFSKESFDLTSKCIVRLQADAVPTINSNKVFGQMETDSSQRLKCPTLPIIPNLRVDLYEQNGLEATLMCEDKKVINSHLKYNGDESSCNNEFIESPLIKKIENINEELDQKGLDLGLEESSYIKWETGTFEKVEVKFYDRNMAKKFDNDTMGPCAIKKETNNVNEVADEELNSRHESLFKSEVIEQEEVEIKNENENEDRLNEKDIDKKLENDVIIVMESSTIIKQETNSENAADEELRRKPANQLMLHHYPEFPYRTIYKSHINSHRVKHEKQNEIDWYNCQECPYKTSQKGNLKRHAEVHNNNLILKCSECSYETLRPRHFKEHQIKHKTNVQWLHCLECSFRSHQPSLLRKHILAHRCDAFKCSQCSYQSRTKGQLTVHQIRHESIDKWHWCSLCLYKTYDKDMLNVHCRRCHGIDPDNPNKIEMFKCTECPYENGDKYNVQRHQLIHNESDWLHCPDCVYNTPYKSDLKKHQLRHQKKNMESWHRCLECPYKTTHKYDFRKHVKSHNKSTEKILSECSQCDFKTTRKDSLRRHELLKHKKSNVCFVMNVRLKQNTNRLFQNTC